MTQLWADDKDRIVLSQLTEIVVSNVPLGANANRRESIEDVAG
jgi:hypothetical protein